MNRPRKKGIYLNHLLKIYSLEGRKSSLKLIIYCRRKIKKKGHSNSLIDNTIAKKEGTGTPPKSGMISSIPEEHSSCCSWNYKPDDKPKSIGHIRGKEDGIIVRQLKYIRL